MPRDENKEAGLEERREAAMEQAANIKNDIFPVCFI